MQPAVAGSYFDYAVFTFAVDDSGAINIPIGVALWSTQMQWAKVRLVDPDEKLERFRGSDNYSFVALMREKLGQWMQTGHLPYAEGSLKPHESEWWRQVRNILVHRIRLSEPRPVDCSDPDSELEPLYESIVSPYRAAREQRSRVDGEITRCLTELSGKFKKGDEFPGYGGRKVRVLRSFKGPQTSVVIEGVNLATSHAEKESDSVVSRLLRLLEAENRVELLLGYLSSPGGLNGEKVLVEWIKHRTGARTFDLQREREQFRREAGDLVAQASMPKPS